MIPEFNFTDAHRKMIDKARYTHEDEGLARAITLLIERNIELEKRWAAQPPKVVYVNSKQKTSDRHNYLSFLQKLMKYHSQTLAKLKQACKQEDMFYVEQAIYEYHRYIAPFCVQVGKVQDITIRKNLIEISNQNPLEKKHGFNRKTASK